jgi:putative PIN family toxin of toxin-antitoxin system
LRAVLDTNVWLSAFLTRNPDSAARLIWNSWRKGLFEVVISHAIVNEIADKLLELGHDQNDADEFVTLLYGLAKTVAIEHQVMGCHDPKDDPFIETAINGHAEYLVTRDKRLLDLPRHVGEYVKARGVSILRDARRSTSENDFCQILRSQPEFRTTK